MVGSVTQGDPGAAPYTDSQGWTKAFMEGLAEMYAIKHGLKGFGLRIGHCSEAPSDARMLSHWSHFSDLRASTLR